MSVDISQIFYMVYNLEWIYYILIWVQRKLQIESKITIELEQGFEK